MGVIFQRTVAQEESFRGNCLIGEIPGDNCLGRGFIGVMVRRKVSQGMIIQGQLPGESSGGSCPREIHAVQLSLNRNKH